MRRESAKKSSFGLLMRCSIKIVMKYWLAW